MDIVLRYRVTVLPDGKQLTDKQLLNPTVHKFSRTTCITACGRRVKPTDRRWKPKRDGKPDDVTCTRCLIKMAKTNVVGKTLQEAWDAADGEPVAPPTDDGAGTPVLPGIDPESPTANAQAEEAVTGGLA